jgi:hypothetical protein
MSSRCRKRGFRILRDCAEQLLQLLKHVVRKAIRRANPNPSDDRLLNPGLVLLTEEPNINQIVNDLACGGIAVKVSRMNFLQTMERTYVL